MPIKSGDIVKLHYTAKFDNGTPFDSSLGQEPVEFKVGAGEIIEGLDEAIVGLEPGAKTEIEVRPEKAYGPYRRELVRKAPREILGGQEVKQGEIIQLQSSDGEILPAQVMDEDEKTVTFDLNHPLAGKVIVFDIEVIKVSEAA